MYAADIGRFSTHDRFSEKYNDWSPYQYGLNNPLRYVDINGDSAWSITNQWNEAYIKKYQEYAPQQIDKYNKAGKEFTCEDLALTIMIDFASENGLPFQFTNGTGTFDAASEDFADVGSFKNAVLETSAARDISDGSNTLPTSRPQSGDLILMMMGSSEIINHTQVITSVTRSKIEIAQGNLNYRILSNSPSSSFYAGVGIQRGVHDRNTGEYQNLTTGNRQQINLADRPRVQTRRWRFYNFNK